MYRGICYWYEGLTAEIEDNNIIGQSEEGKTVHKSRIEASKVTREEQSKQKAENRERACTMMRKSG